MFYTIIWTLSKQTKNSDYADK
ncbi:TPA: 23S rRNA methyltransferase attenuation leader peptide [Enterococcus faecium]|nr:23S rRNA methyltransferase attenuation leader peptide [Enterococcus faecium]HDV6606428.1 23S rRNA methyltransferase attenuation leader peptide [Enterococcus faecalis]HAP6078014.1 23S rRNA methyltransferase attenuation leader peptide [Enterococcus faecium]HAP6089768.1 23S rRNA methyltransferase attenuation leader peptide [Enterococcus faecium]HAP6112804.1 23S rRNA methyltransferase attenuation leader peptide [Enterococcus faecium]